MTGRNRRRREKIFGLDYGWSLNTDQKKRIMAHAIAWSEANKRPGQHNGALTTKALHVLRTLLWDFHNARTGRCFPSYERIAEVAKCAVSTVAKAVADLEAARILTWANRLQRLAFNGITKLIRTSNAYAFNVPEDDLGNLGNLSARHKMPKTPKSENRRETHTQDLSYTMCSGKPVDKSESEAIRANLKALELARTEKFNQEWLKRKKD